MAWLAFRKPHLLQPALMINKAILDGRVECEVRLNHMDGRQSLVHYQLTSAPHQSIKQ